MEAFEGEIANGDFDPAVEILARLLLAGVIDSPGKPMRADQPSHPMRRQGMKYQHSSFSGNDIVGWVVDVSSWSDQASYDWIDHIDGADGGLPLVLMTGAGWALTVRAGQKASQVPRDLYRTLKATLPGGFVQWHSQQDPEWFTPRFTSANEVLGALITEGYVVEATAIDPGLDPYLTECLEDDTFAFFTVSVPDGPKATGCILIEEDFAENAADALNGYLPGTELTASIAGDGWVLRILRTESADIEADAYAEQIGESLLATFTDSPFVELQTDAEPEIDTDEWGPQSREMQDMVVWASRHYLAVVQERWDDERLASWKRITASLEDTDGLGGVMQAERLMARISTNDFFKHTGVEALRALGARELITTEDYDEFTLPWRRRVGRIHPDDPDVALTADANIWQGRRGKF